MISTKITLPLVAVLIFIAAVSISKPIPVSYALENGNTSFTIETPLPPYAFLYHGGNLTIDISKNSPFYPGYGEGLSRDAIYQFDDVIRVENNVTQTGASVICVIITSEMNGLKFYYSNTTPAESISITLGEYESANIGIFVNTTGYALGDVSGSFKIQAFEGACG
ncbi:DUF1102 domain-containing protein [Thermococcus barophilus]|uniref:DUF1102 domain-containing protein n=1 Tax=Thermococcus barophilus (strain DSM 11836 / MP) TaxID=391623 RepID=F0LLD5_THEBM|nr:DUF1102 domain-containing protein [Thermococcus barophilus]ADT84964.1 hypothetical protein TERMP_01990 [Thermococcus barophilus MP]